MIERTTLRFDDHAALRGLEWPCFVARGERGDGPRLTLIAGIHGGEYPAIAAVTRFVAGLDTAQLAGTVTAVPVVSLTSFRARSAFVVPEDGRNLNRCFPGSADGSFSEQLAHAVFERLIRPADALLDLHGGDVFEALEPFSLYEASPVEQASRALAVAFGLRYVVRSVPAEAPIAGTTTAAAAEVGVPAAIAEAGGCGLLEEPAVQLHLDGLANALRQLGMLPGPVAPPRRELRSVGRFVWLRCRRAGWWDPAVGVGEEVRAGDRLGVVRDPWGDVVETVEAPEDGVPLFVTSSPAVGDDGLLLGLGADVGPLA